MPKNVYKAENHPEYPLQCVMLYCNGIPFRSYRKNQVGGIFEALGAYLAKETIRAS